MNILVNDRGLHGGPIYIGLVTVRPGTNARVIPYLTTCWTYFHFHKTLTIWRFPKDFACVDLFRCCCHPVLRKVGRSVETDLFVAKLFSWQASPTKREHTKLEGKHPHSWKIFSFHKKVLHFMGAIKKSEKWDQSTDTRLVFSPKKNPYMMAPRIKRKRKEIWARNLGSWLIYNCPPTSQSFLSAHPL